MSYSKEQLGSMSLQRLAYVLPQSQEEEKEIQEVFDQRASVSTFQTITSIDVRQGWQELILQKYADDRRKSMALEHPATLTHEDESQLDYHVITKEKELELQAKLDKANGRVSTPEPIIDTPVVSAAEPQESFTTQDFEVAVEELPPAPLVEPPKKKTWSRRKKIK